MLEKNLKIVIKSINYSIIALFSSKNDDLNILFDKIFNIVSGYFENNNVNRNIDSNGFF